MKQNSKKAQIIEQKKRLTEQVEKWINEDLENRCAIVILGDRRDQEDLGSSSLLFIGHGDLLKNSLDAAVCSSKPLENIVLHIASSKAIENISECFRELGEM